MVTKRKKKVSVTVDEELWGEVLKLTGTGGPAESASSAAEQGLSLWVANQRLARELDRMYESDPASRPSDEEVARAAAMLRL